MEETLEARGKRLRLQTAVMEDDADADWRCMEDQVEKLEEYTTLLEPGLIQDAMGLVIVQIYLNKMRRSWDGLEET
jgi:hypothetical protein